MAHSNLLPGRVRKALRSFRQTGDHRTRLANIGHLLTGNFIGSLLGLAAFALSARALGPVDYGLLAMIYTFVRVVERVVSFQTWQPIIKYGADLQHPAQRGDLRMLLKFGFLLDLASAVLAFAVAVLGALMGAYLFSWPAETTHLVIAYSSVLLFQLTGMPTAVQRMAGQFRLVAYGQLVNSIARVGLCLVGSLMMAGLPYFVAVWAGTQALGSLIMLGLALHTLRRQGIHRLLTASVRGVTQRFPGIWGFAWSANLSLTLRMSAQEFDTLLVGALTDPAAAGLYHIAKRIGRVGQQVGAQVQAVLYPDVTRLWAQGRVGEFKRLILQIEALLFVASLVGIVAIAVLIHPLLLWTAGPEFLGASSLVVVQMVAVAFVLCGSAMRVGLLAMGRQHDVLRTVVVGTIVFFAVAMLLIPTIGPMGGNIAHIALGICWAGGLSFTLHRALAHHQTARPDPLDLPRDTALLVSKGA
ncbi:lipopolysaccharide biosynthesis protein [Aureimonas phyllosphaerae]|uniref:O-antigen/teichoic acid export membrane protein n=1 Tax=Aureimonas phyllosphaerae TaxID=1166078 RepID=A0A7W6BT60_9HYPH|nr:lipopolysaccharide biosynthesis protein [Aureimonas phyllosphaerae]MBB3937551.1 O-antigen/teichoic acid export membrane protein [Aureimonas phyllosphaerae]MBB3961649.1 O-antigen/teichoic acid export membrane protein [Aureimonas phyllosphaerae]